MSITINAFCLPHHLEELKKHSPKYLKMKIDELPGSTITSGSNPVGYNRDKKSITYSSNNVTVNIIGTAYHVLMKIDPINISLRQWIEILKIVNTTPHNINDDSQGGNLLNRSIDVRNINRHSAIIYKYVPHATGLYTKGVDYHHDYTEPKDGYYRKIMNRNNYFHDQFPVSEKMELYHRYRYEPINIDFTLSRYVNYIVLNVDAYEPSYIESLKRIYREMTDETPIIGWDDDKLDYKYRTDDDSPFISKSELWDLIQKLEHDEDILPRKRAPNPTPSEKIDPPSPVKRSSNKCATRSNIKETIKETPSYVNPRKDLHESSSSDEEIIKVPGWESSSEEEEYNEEASEEISEEEIADENASADSCSIVSDHEPVKPSTPKLKPKRVRLRESLSQETIKDTPNEITDRVDTYENSHESSPAPEEIKAKHTAGYDRAVSDHEPVKALKLSYTTENINIFLVIYAVIMTALVTIGMASR